MKMTHTTLGELLDVKRGMSIASEDCATEGTYKRLTCGNFDYKNHCFAEDNGKDNVYFVGKIREDCLLKKGAIITPLTEQAKGLLGETARIPEDDVYVQSGDIGLVIPYEGKLDDLFAYYLVSSPVVKKQLGAGAQQTKIRHTSPDAIKACEVWVPEDIDIQHQIGEILDKINNKIALNNSICADLEAMAKQIYDYWFVQFDFPDENGRPYKTSGGAMVYNEELKREIPKGWIVRPLEDELETIIDRRGVTPLKLGGDWVKTDGIPALSAKLVKNGHLINLDSANQVSREMYNKWMPQKMKDGDILMTSEAPLGEFYYMFDEPEYCLSQRLFDIRAKDTKFSMYLYYELSSGNGYSQIMGKASGSTVFGIRQDELRKVMILIPDNNLTDLFFDKVVSFVLQSHMLYKENRELAELREFLLPMLMNGQIKVEA